MKYFPFLILTALLLTACGQDTPAPTIPTIPAIPTTIPPTATPLPCSTSFLEPTPIPGVDSLFPAVAPNEWIQGPADAPVTIVTYNDFQCVQCNDNLLTTLAKKYPQDVRLVYRHYPQPELFDKSLLAAQAAEAAGAQGRFWDMHDLLFDKQAEWVQLSPDAFIAWVKNEAEQMGLDMARFETDFTSPSLAAKIQKAVEDGRAAGIGVLPLVLINGSIYSAPKEYNAFDQVIRLTALAKKQFNTCPQMTIDPAKQYLATIETGKGSIVIELYADKAPLTVNAFVFLARNGWYDGVTFHRVIPNFVAQTGDPSGTGLGGPGFVFRNEVNPALHFDKPGMVGMANFGQDTNGSQFFITYGPQPSLDGYYTIFGHVLSGMEVLTQLTPRDPSKDSQLPDGDVVLHIIIEER